MAQLVGTYKLESQENYKEYLLSLGVDEEKATKILNLNENASVTSVDETTVTVEYGGKSINYPINKEIEHELSSGHKVWTTTTVADGSIKFSTKLTADGTLTEEKVLKLVDGLLVITSTNSKGVKAVRKFKKV